MQNKMLITLSAVLFTAGVATSAVAQAPAQASAGTTGGAATDVRDHQSRGHR